MFNSFGKKEVELSKIDFDYVKNCTDARHLRDVVAALENEPYPDLLMAAKKKLFEINPKLSNRGASMPSQDEEAEAKKDLLSFISFAQQSDSNLREKVKKGNTSPLHKLPPVRGFEVPLSAEERHLAEATAQANKIRGKVVDLRDSTKAKAKQKLKAKRETYYKDEDEEHQDDGRYDHLTAEARRTMSVREKEKGNDCYRAKEFEEAVEFYSKSIRLAGAKAAAAAVLHTNRAMAWMKLEHFDRAEQDCNRAIQLNPSSAKGYWRRGLALQGRKMFGRAIRDLERAQTLSPGDKGIARALEKAQAELQGSGEAVQEEKSDKGKGRDQIVGKTKSGFSRMVIEEVSSSDDEEEEEEEKEDSKEPEEGLRRVMILEDSEDEEEDEGKDSLDTEQSRAAADARTLAAVAQAKQAGNGFFKAKDYSNASLSYSKAIDAFGTLSEDAKAKEAGTRHALLTNRALAYIKGPVDRKAAAAADCESVLGDALAAQLSKDKALYRRGLARLSMGEWAAAEADLARVWAKNPTATVQRELAQARKQLQRGQQGGKGKGKGKGQGKGIQIEELEDPTLQAEQQRLEAEREVAKAKRAADQRAQRQQQQQRQAQVAGKKQASSPLANGAGAGVGAGAEGGELPSPPKSSTDFNTAWKGLRRDNARFLRYFKEMDPNALPKMFKLDDSLTSEHLESICLVLGAYAEQDPVRCFAVLSALPQTARFSLNLMMASKKANAGIKQAFQKLRTTDANISGEALAALEKQYK